MKILLITRYFPPLDSIATSRMVSFAKYLSRKNCSLTVLTTSKKGQVNIPFAMDPSKFEVIEVPYFDPIAALRIDRLQKKTSSSSFWAPIKKQIKTRLIDFYRSHMNERLPGRTDLWVLKGIKKLKALKKEGYHFDRIISSYGPPTAHMLGYAAKKIFNCYWIADYRDLWIENDLYKGLWPFKWIEKKIESCLLKKAEMITTVSSPLQQTLIKKFYPIPVHIVENGFDEEQMSKVKGDYFSHKEKKFRLVYTGSLYWEKRNPLPLFKALLELRNEKALTAQNFELLFYGSYTGPLLETIEKMELQSLVRYRGIVGKEEALSIQKSADCFLFLESPDSKGILTGKLFEYLYFPSPILAIGIKKDSTAAKIIEKANSGYIAENSVPLIKDLIIELIKGVSLTKNISFINQFSREAKAEKLYQLIL